MHELAKEGPMDQLLFRRAIARFYLRKLVHRQFGRLTSSTIEDLRLDGTDHLPEKLPNRVRCVVCITEAVGVAKCKKTLCIEKPCFQNFHS